MKINTHLYIHKNIRLGNTNDLKQSWQKKASLPATSIYIQRRKTQVANTV